VQRELDALALLIARCGTDPFVAGPLVSEDDFAGWVPHCLGVEDALARLLALALGSSGVELELVHVAPGSGRGVRLLAYTTGRATFATELLGNEDREAVLEDIARAVGSAFASAHELAVGEVVAAVYLGLGRLITASEAHELVDLQLMCRDDVVLARLGLPTRRAWPKRRHVLPAAPDRASLPRATVRRIRAQVTGRVSADDVMAAVRCPHCGHRPAPNARWGCYCGHVWNTFETRGLCARCRHSWRDTVCLACSAYAPHARHTLSRQECRQHAQRPRVSNVFHTWPQ